MSTVRVYKICNQYYGLDNLERRRLKISTIRDLNDPFEFQSFSLPNVEHRRAWERARKTLMKSVGLISFSLSWHNPVLWSHYGDCHRGIALGFDVPDHDLSPVKYKAKRGKLPDILKTNPSVAILALRSSLSEKFEHWRYEEEMRVFTELATRCVKTGLYFRGFDEDLKLKEVILGPMSALTSSEVRSIAGEEKLSVTTSRLAFNSYKVVRQRNASLQK